MIPVVDIFAGPGGLGEGFSSHVDGRGRPPFKLALSIEKDATAHATLRLRAFRRQFDDRPPDVYDRFLRGELGWKELASAHPIEAEVASDEARHFELGPEPSKVSQVRSLIRKVVDPDLPWVLIGGPPCQAYSIVGRSRNSGRSDYNPDEDRRQTLYVEYLQILADHAPPIFVMENVKGLLSARLKEQSIFDRILGDLREPALALKRESRKHVGKRPGYQIRSLVVPSEGIGPTDYVVRAEHYGIPQRRHRVVLVGIRDDVSAEGWRPLNTTPGFRSVEQAIGRFPKLRSGISRALDSDQEWLDLLSRSRGRAWFKSVEADVRRRISATLEALESPAGGRGAEYLRRGHGRPVLNHATRSHIREDLERYLFASSFALERNRSPSLADFPRALLPRHANVQHAVEASLFSDRFRVQIASRSSTTITSHIAKDGHYYIHYDPAQCRSLTVREAATLQTFPPDYFFCGGRTSQYSQVGNAVPPVLARQIAGVVARLL